MNKTMENRSIVTKLYVDRFRVTKGENSTCATVWIGNGQVGGITVNEEHHPTCMVIYGCNGIGYHVVQELSRVYIGRLVPPLDLHRICCIFWWLIEKLVLVYEINKKLWNIYMQRIYTRSCRIEFEISTIACVGF